MSDKVETTVEAVARALHAQTSRDRAGIADSLLRDLACSVSSQAADRLEEYSGLISRWRWLAATPFEKLPEQEKQNLLWSAADLLGLMPDEEEKEAA